MKSGFIALVGRPNVGKSSLVNKILNYKLSIVSSKPQTTRNKINGIYNDNDSQIIFVDTPGIHKPQQKVGESYNDASFSALNDADITLFLSPINDAIGPGDKLIINKIKNKNIAIITKIDEGDANIAKEKATKLKELGFRNVIGTSINIDDSIDHLITFLKNELPIGNSYYDREDITDKNMRFLVKEIIRESVIEYTRDEIPHSVGIEINNFKGENPIHVEATIHVERNSQKGMVIGKDGKMIKNIGINSRKKILEIFGIKNIVNLKVKVSKNWTKDSNMIRKLGY